jgi:hypothetical protein
LHLKPGKLSNMPHPFRTLFNHTQDAVWMADEAGRR